MRVWPGDPYPLGATWTGVGVNFALFSAHATKVELCLFDSPDATTSRARIALPEQTDMVWHGVSARRAAEPALRLPRPRPVRPGRPATVSIRTRLSWIHTRNRSARTIRWADEMFGYRVGDPDEDLSFDDRDNAALRAARRRRRSGVHLGRRSAAAHAVAQHGHLRDARARLHEAAPRHPRASARHLRSADDRAGARAPEEAGRHGRRADAGASPRARSAPRRARADATTGATTASATSRRSAASRRRRRRPARCASSSGWCARCTPPASR